MSIEQFHVLLPCIYIAIYIKYVNVRIYTKPEHIMIRSAPLVSLTVDITCIYKFRYLFTRSYEEGLKLK